jgi:hypothetical protein
VHLLACGGAGDPGGAGDRVRSLQGSGRYPVRGGRPEGGRVDQGEWGTGDRSRSFLGRVCVLRLSPGQGGGSAGDDDAGWGNSFLYIFSRRAALSFPGLMPEYYLQSSIRSAPRRVSGDEREDQ